MANTNASAIMANTNASAIMANTDASAVNTMADWVAHVLLARKFTTDITFYQFLGGFATVVIVYYASVICYRLFFSTLAKFPGPKLAAATSWYEGFIDLWSNNFPDVLNQMHEKYGPIVRVNPWELSIKDPEYYSEVYVSAGKRRTETQSGLRAGLGISDAISTTSGHELHQLRRRAVENFFSRQSITHVESRIHDETRILDSKLQRLAGTGTVIALDHAFSCFSGDLSAQFACGENPHFIEDPDFSPEWHKSLMGVLAVVPIVRNLTWINSVLKLVPVALIKALNPKAAGFRMFALLGEDRIEKIKAEIANETKEGRLEEKTSVFHHILRSDLPDSEKDTARLKREAFALLAAGTITTSGTLSLITYYILANPEIESRLREELKDVTACFPDKVPTWAALEKVPILVGCIKEGLRIACFFRRNTRIAPDVELQYKQWTIPKNTPVGMSVCYMHMDPDVYPEPHKFKPERWIGDYDPRMNRNLVPFLRGSRNCLGLNLAWAEMYVLLGTLFRPGGHKMSLDCDESDMVPIYDSDIGVPKRDSRGLRVRIH